MYELLLICDCTLFPFICNSMLLDVCHIVILLLFTSHYAVAFAKELKHKIFILPLFKMFIEAFNFLKFY